MNRSNHSFVTEARADFRVFQFVVRVVAVVERELEAVDERAEVVPAAVELEVVASRLD
jgi:hypothetical protein